MSTLLKLLYALPSLTTLSLAGNALSPSSLSLLANLPVPTGAAALPAYKLRVLDLSFNDFSKADPLALVHVLKKFAYLREVGLRSAEDPFEGVSQLGFQLNIDACRLDPRFNLAGAPLNQAQRAHNHLTAVIHSNTLSTHRVRKAVLRPQRALFNHQPAASLSQETGGQACLSRALEDLHISDVTGAITVNLAITQKNVQLHNTGAIVCYACVCVRARMWGCLPRRVLISLDCYVGRCLSFHSRLRCLSSWRASACTSAI